MEKQKVLQALIASGHFSANDDAIVTDITKLITNHEQGKRPYYIYDSSNGVKLGMSQLPVFEKRLQAFGGDILAMFASYKGRSASKETGSNNPRPPANIIAQAGERKFPVKPGTVHEVQTTKTNKDGDPIEQEWITYEEGKVVKRDVRQVEAE